MARPQWVRSDKIAALSLVFSVFALFFVTLASPISAWFQETTGEILNPSEMGTAKRGALPVSGKIYNAKPTDQFILVIRAAQEMETYPQYPVLILQLDGSWTNEVEAVGPPGPYIITLYQIDGEAAQKLLRYFAEQEQHRTDKVEVQGMQGLPTSMTAIDSVRISTFEG